MITKAEIIEAALDRLFNSEDCLAIIREIRDRVKLVPVDEAARMLRVSPSKIKRLFPVYDLGRPRVKLSDIEYYLEKCKL